MVFEHAPFDRHSVKHPKFMLAVAGSQYSPSTFDNDCTERFPHPLRRTLSVVMSESHVQMPQTTLEFFVLHKTLHTYSRAKPVLRGFGMYVQYIVSVRSFSKFGKL